MANPELNHKYIAVAPDGTPHGFDDKRMFDNVKRLHGNDPNKAGWVYGESKDYDALLRQTKAGMNIVNAELIGEKYELKSRIAELEKMLAEKNKSEEPEASVDVKEAETKRGRKPATT